MKRKVFWSTLILILGGVICKVIGALYRVPLSRIIGVEGLGVYQLIFPVYAFLLSLISGGVCVSLSKLVAEERALKRYKSVKKIFKISFVLFFSLSLIFSILFYFFSVHIARFQGNIEASIGYKIISISLLFAGIIPVFRGYFQGFENMLPGTVSQIIEQLSKLVLGILFAYLFNKSKGYLYGVYGAILGVSLGELIAFVYVFIKYLSHRKILNEGLQNEGVYTTKECLKKILKTTIPITLNSLVMPTILMIDSVLIVNLLSHNFNVSHATAIYGTYSGIVNALINFPSIISISIASIIVPTFSYSKSIGESNSSKISSILKVSLCIAIPCYFVFMLLSSEIIGFIYKNSAVSLEIIKLTSTLLKITSINVIYTTLIYVITAIFQATEKMKIPLINMLIGGAIRIVLTIYLVKNPRLNIFGASIASIVGYSIIAILNLIKLRQYYFIKIEKKELNSLLFSTLLFGVILFLSKFLITTSYEIIIILSSLLISGTLYLILLCFLPVFNKDELYSIPYGEKIYRVKLKTNKLFRNNIDGNNLYTGGSDE